MIFPLNAPMFDLLVLSVVLKEDAYGYQISQIIKQVSNTKDSTLYPVLRRLQENHFLATYDQQYQGRNRKYYSITEEGRRQYEELVKEWKNYSDTVNRIVEEELTMNRNEYMKRHGYRLRRLPKEDFDRAMEYFTEYFEEAGPENEQQAIEDLGAPEAAADQIVRDMAFENAREKNLMSKKGDFQWSGLNSCDFCSAGGTAAGICGRCCSACLHYRNCSDYICNRCVSDLRLSYWFPYRLSL